MKTQQLFISLALGLGLTLALLSLLGSPPEVVLAQAGSGIIRVAPPPTGNDVPNCGGEANPCRTVQYAVDQAQAGDEVLIASGTYTGVSARAGVTQVVYISKTVTVRGGYTTTNWLTSDPESHPTTLDAQRRGRVLYIAGNISPTIEGLRITSGNAAGMACGGVYVFTATATISNNQVFSNTSDSYGGGLCLRRSSGATLSGNTIISNTAIHRGGGLYIEVSNAATLISNTFRANATATSPFSLSIGGGLCIVASDATLNSNTLISNTAHWGGGLYLAFSSATLQGNTISYNVADSGGGLVLADSDAMLINNVVADNRADSHGSGLSICGSSLGSLHTTIARNTSSDGNGVYVTSYTYWQGTTPTTYYSTVALTNTILVSHTVGITVTAGNTATLETTLWGTDIWANGTDWGGAGTIIPGTRNYWGAPAFVNPDAGDYHIGLTSAAIDKGVNAGVTTDIDDDARPDGCFFDIGADEFITGVACKRIYLPLIMRQYP